MKKTGLDVSLKEAKDIIINSIKPLGCEEVSIFQSTGRILYGDIVSDIMNPPLDNSGMDGYAVIADDTTGVSKDKPVSLKITGEIQAGGSFSGMKIIKGTAIRIMTGAPIPFGADAVIPVEDTKEDNSIVYIYRELKKHENYRFAGEDIRRGDIVLNKGDRLTSADMGLLSSLNYKTIKVYQCPRVAILSTGDELADLGNKLQPGQIRNSNSYILYSEIKKYNAIPDYLGIAKDTIAAIKKKFLKALKNDVVISTGGVSMGKYDFVMDIYKDLNINIKFEKVKIKPGRQSVFGIKDNKLFFGLPGNPVSTLNSFIQFVRPAILKLMGANRLTKPVVNATLVKDIIIKSGFELVHILRGHFIIKNNEFFVSTTGPQGSNILRSITLANCFIIIPEDQTTIKAGSKVIIQLIDHDEIL